MTIRRRGLVPLTTAALIAATVPALATGPVSSLQTTPTPRVTTLAPGVTHERVVMEGNQVVHVLRARANGRTSLQPVQAGGSPSARGSLLSALAPLRDSAGAVAGINGDFFNFTSGNPSGVLLIDNQLISEPEASRSALLIRSDGLLDAAILALAGSWQGLDVQQNRRLPLRTLQGLNRPAQRSAETILYTTAYGRPATPAGRDINEVRIRLDEDLPLRPGQPVTGIVVGVGTGASTIGRGHMVLAGVGSSGRTLVGDLQPGRRVTITPGLVTRADNLPTPAELVSAVGGGPLLVRDGQAVSASGEGLSSSQTDQRTARTAVGQTADGTLLLVAAAGPVQGSPGISAAQQAELLAGLGARVAVAMDAGGSAQLAVGERHLLDWGSSPRSLANAIAVNYHGLLVDPTPGRISPNADRVDDLFTAVVRSPQAGHVGVRIARRNGAPRRTLWRGQLAGTSARITVDPRALRLPDGIYTLTARLTPADGSPQQTTERRVIIDRTLGSLTARASGAGARQRLTVGMRLVRPARVTVTVRDGSGRAVAVLARGRAMKAGRQSLNWNRRVGGRPVSGSHRVEVVAVSAFGRSGLVREVRLSAPRQPEPTP